MAIAKDVRGDYVSMVLFALGTPLIMLEYSLLKKHSAKKVLKGFKEMGFSRLKYGIFITEGGIIIKNPEKENSMTLEYGYVSKIIEFDTFILFLTKQNSPYPLVKDSLNDKVKYDFLDMIIEKNPKIKFINIR